MVKNDCGQSGYKTLKLNVFQEWTVGINWFFHDATNSGKLKVASITFGYAWSFSSCDCKICCILRLNWRIELIFCIMIVMQQFLIRLISYSMYLTFKCWGLNVVVLVFLILLIIPEIVIILNQRNNLLLWVFDVFILYLIGQYFKINIFKNGGLEKNIKGVLTI